MEQSTPQNMLRDLPRAPVNSGSAPDYWNNLDALCIPSSDQHAHPAPQRLQQPPQPQQPPPQQQPMGISWDHPVFSQQHPQQTTPLPPQQEHGHGMYPSAANQSWRANSLHHQPILPSGSPHGFGVPGQYRQLHQFPQGQVPFDSRPLTPSDNSAYQTFPFPRNYYPPQHLAVQDTFSQSPTPQATQTPPQSVQYQPVAHSNAINGYPLSTTFPDENAHPLGLSHEFPEPIPSVPGHQTINPQFLDTPQATNQHPTFSNYLYVNSNDFQGSQDPKVFDFYRNDIQLQAVPPAVGNQGVPVRPQGVEGFMPANGQKPVAVPLPIKAADARKQITKILPKNATGKVNSKRVDGKMAGYSGSESDSDDSDLEIEHEPPEKSPIPPSRPTEPEAAANYDTLRAVWFPRNRRPNAEKVKSALVAFKDVVKKVRDAWKDKTQAMKMAENKGDNDKAAKFKKETGSQRRIMDMVVKTTLERAHPMILEKLGEHPIAVSAMYSFLLDRHQASDIDGTFTVHLLELLSRFTTMDDEALQKTNVAKLLPRFVKKGGAKVRGLAQKILDNAAASTKRKQETVKPGSKEGSPNRNGASTDMAPTEAPGAKRARENDNNGLPATKKMVVTSNIKNPSKPSNPVVASGPAKKPQEGAAAIAARPKANIVAPKPTNLFGSLSSASKRPGTSNAERAAAAAAAPRPSTLSEKKDPQPAAPKPAFSFGDIMADLNKQKDPAPAQPAEDKAPETEEERKKRLRKEARRRLRVTWKPDSQLVQVRTFTHDPDEELHLGDHEVGDVKGEGSVLKLHRDMDEMDEDDDGGLREESLLDYHEPTAIDDENITSPDRSGNFVKRGGAQQPISPEKEAQDHREATTLMVFYTSAADVPPSPKEPPAPADEEIVTDVVDFGEFPDKVKARQERYYSMINPKPAPPVQPSAQNNNNNNNNNGQFDISNLLKIIQNAPQQQQSTPPPPPPQLAPQAPMSDLERTISMFRQQQAQPAQAPVMQMPQFPPVSQPPATQGLDFQKILAVINAQKQMQQPPVMPQPPPQPQPQQSQPNIAPNLAAIISQIANPNQQATPNFSQQQSNYEDPDRKRMREGNGYDGHDDDRYGHPKRGRPGPGKRHPKAGLVPCRYWPEGKCIKGDDCTFRHDPLN
ncbi:uncharacterized protein LDX57_002102 [Aspergillus melleus]|uniref:uncharacterized protein n=1 Tax=Aspergillus melleus TaxID=138277 RepID=UPI001E8D2975|nr:uncharacterized protein LDX57_002102 [Aspergillus melleus]KAH8424351.1 hypothetical protein LDX57_002102 [Aspergillus melleus]